MPKSKKVTVGVEVTPKKAFASALEWPGWSRADKTPEEAVAALAAHAERYAAVAKRAKVVFPFDGSVAFDITEQAEGNASTAFGIPEVRFEADRRRTTAKDGEQLAAIVDAAWKVFDRIVAGAPAELPRALAAAGATGTRSSSTSSAPTGDTHGTLGLKAPDVDPRDRAAVADLRKRMLEAIGAGRSRRLADRRKEVAGPLRSAPGGVARTRPRLGDRGPQRALRVDKPGRLPRPSPFRSWRY